MKFGPPHLSLGLDTQVAVDSKNLGIQNSTLHQYFGDNGVLGAILLTIILVLTLLGGISTYFLNRRLEQHTRLLRVLNHKLEVTQRSTPALQQGGIQFSQ